MDPQQDASAGWTPWALVDVVFFDCQATGATPSHGHLLEAAWSGPDGCADTVVRLPAGASIPARVSSLTGIGEADLASGRSAGWVFAHLREALLPQWGATLGPAPAASPLALGTSPRAMVVHFAQFESRWLNALWGAEAEVPFPVICTHEIARRLFPDLPSRGLRALAGYLGYDSPEPRRSRDHVAATRFIWSQLVPELASRGLRDAGSVLEWVRVTPVPARSSAFAYRVPRERRLALPEGPGVYRFLGAQGEVLYVGKATCLRRRVNSYFQKRRGRADHKQELVTRAHDLAVSQTGSPLEAALLETDEIKRHDPVCNRALRPEGRAPVWSSPDLLSVAPTPDDKHTLGPWPRSPRAAGLLAAGCEDPDQLFTWGERWAPDAAVFTEGLRLFRARYDVANTASLLRLGDILWARRDASEEDEECEVVPVRGWCAQTVCESLEDLARSTALLARRAFWFQQIAAAEIWFRAAHDGSPRCVNVEPEASDLPAIAGYDRLRVLTSELRRLCRTGDSVAMRLACGTVLDVQQLRGALAWV